MSQFAESVNLVIDIGSSSLRVVAFSLTGQIIASEKLSYETFYPSLGWAEQNPNDWIDSTLRALTRLMRTLPKNTRVNGLSCTGQCPTMVLVDRNFHLLGNALTYQDNRSLKESLELVSDVGNNEVHFHSGHSIEPFFILPKLLWIKNNRGEIYNKIHKVIQPVDFIEHFLTGNLFTDGAYACSTLAYDFRTGNWNTKLLNRLELDPGLFPQEIINSWDMVGPIKDEIAELTGLPKGLPVIRGGPDSQCCSLGVAAIASDVLSNMSGTSTCLNRTITDPIDDLGVGNYVHVLPDKMSAEVGLNTTGLSLRKIADLLFPELDEISLNEQVKNSLSTSPMGSHNLFFFPYLSDGERDNQQVKGGFYNLNMMVTKADLIRSVLEGVAFAEQNCLVLLL